MPTTSTEVEPEVVSAYTAMIREQILFSLKVWPYVSPSQLHVGLGTATPSNLWRMVLDGLIEEGLVCKRQIKLISPRERNQTYTILHLACNDYIPPEGVLSDTASSSLTDGEVAEQADQLNAA